MRNFPSFPGKTTLAIKDYNQTGAVHWFITPFATKADAIAFAKAEEYAEPRVARLRGRNCLALVIRGD